MEAMQVRDITPAFASEITSIDLRDELDRATRSELRRLFDTRGLLVFRGIDLDHESQVRLCSLLIGDEGPSVSAGRPPRYISNVDPEGLAPYGRLMFHTDMMWAPEPFQVLSLYAVEVGEGVAATSLTSSARAWETLPDDLRARVAGLHARHSTGQVYGRGGDDLLHPQRAEERTRVTPVVLRHPRTGELVLYVTEMNTQAIVELPPHESEDLLRALFEHLYDPSVVVEHHWKPGDLVVFDNLAVQHARGNVELDGAVRTLRKVIAPIPTIDAERPRFARAGSSPGM
jgi:alpha-ketoglutarate-dependent taurine dioxygenase